MTPIQFNGCVGWFHAGNRPHGIVICEPLGHEALWLHKLVRSLAEHLADRGFPVLRFHYPASGDSLGDEHDADRFDHMLASVRHAVDALRERVVSDTLTLVGVRAGAALALLAADGIPGFTRFVALAPVVRGRGYLRELSLVAQRWLDNAPPAVRDAIREERPLHVLGHAYPDDLVAALRGINLCESAGRFQALPSRALLVDAPYGDAPALSDALQARGVSVDVRTCPDWGSIMREPVWSRLPDGLLDTIANWTDDGSDAAVRVPVRESESPVTLAGEGCIERLISVGPGRLAGVLCEPAGSIRRAAAPTLLITNTAANPHVADGRFAVRLARSLAASGISSLRIDSSGIGDSGPRARDDQSDIPYSDQVIVDIASAADWLKEQGHREIVAFGICSGAYASLHAAAREHFAGVIAVNLPVFIWPRGATLADAVNNQTNSMRGYWASLRSRHKLRRLILEGRDPRPVLRALFRLVAGIMTVPVKRVGEHFGWRPGNETPRGLLHGMSTGGIRTHLVYGTFDTGVDALVRHFGPASRAFAHWPNVSVDLQDTLDHSLHGNAAAQYVVTRCAELLASWYAPAEFSVPAQPEHAPS
ncbi:alpha/beta hydrolase [Burkholderia lata]|uniref:serine aminopeptidase domain-containing protein n=1 Tax=Burkholderia lata (strain ATCC 17760 / DSM 23089 / LMG 22485 / NCIMB 9086 / R18194 / 383) TaxID=482957 RepID=UPI001454B766|nr:alpha/beta hydrolase [Burkholderia lata]VWB34561.1 alpha/beta hydrolase [Burkholderia lata]